MLIAYDLRYASDHFPGIGTHAFWLLKALLDAKGEESYAVLWNPALSNARVPLDEGIRGHARVSWQECAIAPLGGAGAWSLGHLLRRLRPSLYFSPFSLHPVDSRCPTVLTLHDVIPIRVAPGPGVLTRMMFRIGLARAAGARALVTSSEFSRREIVSCGFPSDRLRVIRPGVPGAPSGHPRPPRDLPEGPFALVVGINKPHKNLETLVRGWAGFGDAPPLRLVSAGPEDSRYEGFAAMTARLGATRVTALGRVREDELRWLYLNATLFVFPSRYEGFGFPMVEAFAAGVAVLASDIPALRELGDGCAKFVPADDAAAWRQAIGALSKDVSERAGLARAGAERAHELSYARTAAATLDLFHEVTAA